MMKLFFKICMVLFCSYSWAQNETSVLFIGNSFTFMNSMPFMFRDIAESQGKKIFVDTVVEGGKDFDYHAHSAETYAAINSRNWDYVIIQGHSNELAQPESIIDKKSLPFAKQIVDSIQANSSCTQVVLYMTWGYKNGNPKWSAVASYDSMQERISNQYMRFADLLNARISPVGEVWKTIRKNYNGLNLYHPDNIHPSFEGSYLIASTFYASIFGESPFQNNAIVALSSDVRKIIDLNVSQLVLNNLNKWRFIQNTQELKPGFDAVITEKELKIYNTSQNASWVEWNFGDGQISIEENPSHTYNSPGTYQFVQKVNIHCKSLELIRTIEIK